MRSALVALAFATALPAVSERAQAAPEAVDIRHGEFTLRSTLFRPDGPGPFPAVIGLHSCEGLNNTSGTLSSRYRDWADRLNKAGFVILFPDSYGSRNMSNNQCRTRASIRTDRERMDDAYAARKWLQGQPYVNAQHVSLLGWSNGGIGVLWTVRPRARVRDDKPDFRSAVAMYPGCRKLDTAAWAARIPTLILIGGADDVVSSRACEQMVAGSRGRSARVQIVVYPGAYHDFDHPNRAVQSRSGYTFSTEGTGKVHTGTNPAARADALRRVPAWLAR
jgi:dienelactone hydrolase